MLVTVSANLFKDDWHSSADDVHAMLSQLLPESVDLIKAVVCLPAITFD